MRSLGRHFCSIASVLIPDLLIVVIFLFFVVSAPAVLFSIKYQFIGICLKQCTVDSAFWKSATYNISLQVQLPIIIDCKNNFRLKVKFCEFFHNRNITKTGIFAITKKIVTLIFKS